jgi:hypothetical protein
MAKHKLLVVTPAKPPELSKEAVEEHYRAKIGAIIREANRKSHEDVVVKLLLDAAVNVSFSSQMFEFKWKLRQSLNSLVGLR